MPIVTINGHGLKDGFRFEFNWSFPSVVVKEYLTIGHYPDDGSFIKNAIKAIIEANKRVVQKYGFYCTFSKELEEELKELLTHSLTNIEIIKMS